jgi:hypothetical protein
MPRYSYLYPNVFKFKQRFNTNNNTTLLTSYVNLFLKKIIERVSSSG